MTSVGLDKDRLSDLYSRCQSEMWLGEGKSDAASAGSQGFDSPPSVAIQALATRFEVRNAKGGGKVVEATTAG